MLRQSSHVRRKDTRKFETAFVSTHLMWCRERDKTADFKREKTADFQNRTKQPISKQYKVAGWLKIKIADFVDALD